eukprot:Sspe_Gene.30073::Locus_14665_Transcript_3_3_Confidence_0.600_Length_2094::g.30073::m.30073
MRLMLEVRGSASRCQGPPPSPVRGDCMVQDEDLSPEEFDAVRRAAILQPLLAYRGVVQKPFTPSYPTIENDPLRKKSSTSSSLSSSSSSSRVPLLRRTVHTSRRHEAGSAESTGSSMGITEEEVPTFAPPVMATPTRLVARALKNIIRYAARTSKDLIVLSQVCSTWRRVCMQDADLWVGDLAPPPGWAAGVEGGRSSKHQLVSLKKGLEPLRHVTQATRSVPINSVITCLTRMPVGNTSVLCVLLSADSKGEVAIRAEDGAGEALSRVSAFNGTAVTSLVVLDRGKARWVLALSVGGVAVVEIPKVTGSACMTKKVTAALGNKLKMAVVCRLMGHEVGSTVLCTAGHQAMVATGGTDRCVALWDTRTTTTPNPPPTRLLRRHTLAVSKMRATAETLVTGGRDALVCVWDWDGTLLRELAGHCGPICGLEVRGGLVVSLCAGGVLRWRKGDDGSSVTLPWSTTPSCLACSSDGKIAGVGGMDGSIALVRLADTRVVSLVGHDDVIVDLTIDPTQGWAASSGNDGLVYLWDFTRFDSEVAPSNIVGDGVCAAVTCFTIITARDGKWKRIISAGGDRSLLDTSLEFRE